MCLATGDEKTLIYHTVVIVARKVKILPSNPLVVVVSPLNALIDDQCESCQRPKLKAVEMVRELFDNDDTLKELKNAEVLYCSPETLENIRSKYFFLRMANQLIGIVVEKSHCLMSW